MKPITKISSRLVPLPNENVDTDQIAPARFLKTTTKTGLAGILFHDWRYDSAGNPRPDFILNRPEVAGASVLLAGANFGCGSSREHAPWALYDFGFRAIISTSFADIFRNNCLKNGILPIIVDPRLHDQLLAQTEEDMTREVMIDLATQTLLVPDGTSVSFPIDPFSKRCLLEGLDDLGYILKYSQKISQFEALHTTPWPPS